MGRSAGPLVEAGQAGQDPARCRFQTTVTGAPAVTGPAASGTGPADDHGHDSHGPGSTAGAGAGPVAARPCPGPQKPRHLADHRISGRLISGIVT